jgi:lactose/L-arabinose transport system permease protein
MTTTLTPPAAAAAATKAAPPRRRLTGLRMRSVPYLFLAPVIVLFLAFKAYPVFYALYLSLTTNEAGATVFVGADNFVRLFGDQLFWTALGNTLQILVVQVPIMLIVAVILSVAFNSALLKARSFFRVAYFVPIVMGLVAYGILFSALFNFQNGFFNYLLGLVGIAPVPWLADPFWARMSIVLALTWHYVGQNAVIYLAQLQSIPDELYEAASVDGASRLQKFWYVTLPGLRPALVLTIVLSTIGTLQLFDEPYVLTNGGPNNATLTIGMYLYQNAFQYFDFGYASAIGYVLTAIIALFAIVQAIVLRRRAR